jgi:DNA-directed RNA polymerase subunit RPC12/RpoP
MANDNSIRAFKCPTCGAPLEPSPGVESLKCSYCGGTVVIPESLRIPAPSAPGSLPQGSFGHVDMNAMLTQMNLFPRVYTLAQQGKFDEAAQIYMQLSGLSLEAALKAVKGMARSNLGG